MTHTASEIAKLREKAKSGPWKDSNDFDRAQDALFRALVDAYDSGALVEREQSIDLNYKLPCDVRIPPITTIKKGCKLETLLIGIRRREKTAAEFRDEREQSINDEILKQVLREHWLTGIHCDHENETDTATCYCTVWKSAVTPTVGAALERWIDHLFEHIAIASAEAGRR